MKEGVRQYDGKDKNTLLIPVTTTHIWPYPTERRNSNLLLFLPGEPHEWRSHEMWRESSSDWLTFLHSADWERGSPEKKYSTSWLAQEEWRDLTVMDKWQSPKMMLFLISWEESKKQLKRISALSTIRSTNHPGCPIHMETGGIIFPGCSQGGALSFPVRLCWS